MDGADFSKNNKAQSAAETANFGSLLDYRPKNPFEEQSKSQPEKREQEKTAVSNTETVRPGNPFDAASQGKKQINSDSSSSDVKPEQKATDRPESKRQRGEEQPGKPMDIPIKVPGLPDFWIYDGKLKPGLPDPRADKPGEGQGQTKTEDASRPNGAVRPYEGTTRPQDGNSVPQQKPDNKPGHRDGNPNDSPLVPGGNWSKPSSNLPFVPGDTQPFPKRDTEKEVPNSPSGPQTPERIVELFKMNNRSADHAGPDAVVRLPKNFDPNKPINLVIYNHGWGDTVKSSYSKTGMGQQLDNAPPNTVLILPEWQAQAGASNGNQGRFSEAGRIRSFLQEVLDKTPGLNGKTLNDVKNIDVISHSAGDNATLSLVNNNGLEKKISSLTLLDSMYNTTTGFDNWIQMNIQELAKGTKQFRNIYFDKAARVEAQADRVRDMMRRASLNDELVYHDNQNGQSVMDASDMAKHGIVYRYSRVGGGDAHGHMPKVYIAPVVGAAKIMRR